jgi:hypothetical protein
MSTSRPASGLPSTGRGRVQVVSADGISADDGRPMVRDVVEAELGRLPDFCAKLIRGAHSVC